MTIKDGWFDWAKKEPGHPEKVYAGTNESKGVVWHSAEGYLASLIRLVQSYERKASWTGSIAFDGTLYQHYPVSARCWASGNHLANSRYWSFELEGTAGNRISDEQIQTCLRIAHEFEAHTGMKATRKEAGPRTMWEHQEVAQIATPNAGPTSCPSHRYDPFFALLDREGASGQGTEEDDMDPADKALLYAIAQAIVPLGAGDAPAVPEWTKRLKEIDTNDTELTVRHAALNAVVNTLKADVDALKARGPGALPDHTHIPGGVA